MSDESLTVSVLDAVCANTAIIRNMLVYLLRAGTISVDEPDTLFLLTKQDLAEGRYPPATVEGAQSYLEGLYQSMGIATIQPNSDITH